LGVDHPYIRLLETVPGIGWVLGYTIASEIGDIHRFSSAKKLVGYTGLCPRAYQSGQQDRRGALAKNGPRYLRWALIEAAMHASRNARYTERYQRTARRLGAQRGRKAARVELARDLRPRSGTCSPATRSSPRQVPLSLWSHDDPSLNWTAGANAPVSGCSAPYAAATRSAATTARPRSDSTSNRGPSEPPSPSANPHGTTSWSCRATDSAATNSETVAPVPWSANASSENVIGLPRRAKVWSRSEVCIAGGSLAAFTHRNQAHRGVAQDYGGNLAKLRRFRRKQ
jgi:hypothetical protein